MAYTATQWSEYNPDRMFLYDKEERAALKEELEKAELYLNWYYSAPKLLENDTEYKALNASLGEKTNLIVELLSLGNKLTPADFKHLNTGQFLADKAKYNLGIEKAKILSALIEEQRKAGPDAIFDIVYSDKTPLSSIDKTSTYKQLSISALQNLGFQAGKTIAATIPPTIAEKLGSGYISLRLGMSALDAIKQLATKDSELAKAVERIKKMSLDGFGKEATEKGETAIIDGIMKAMGNTYSAQIDHSASLAASWSSYANSELTRKKTLYEMGLNEKGKPLTEEEIQSNAVKVGIDGNNTIYLVYRPHGVVTLEVRDSTGKVLSSTIVTKKKEDEDSEYKIKGEKVNVDLLQHTTEVNVGNKDKDGKNVSTEMISTGPLGDETKKSIKDNLSGVMTLVDPDTGDTYDADDKNKKEIIISTIYSIGQGPDCVYVQVQGKDPDDNSKVYTGFVKIDNTHLAYSLLESVIINSINLINAFKAALTKKK